MLFPNDKKCITVLRLPHLFVLRNQRAQVSTGSQKSEMADLKYCNNYKWSKRQPVTMLPPQKVSFVPMKRKYENVFKKSPDTIPRNTADIMNRVITS